MPASGVVDAAVAHLVAAAPAERAAAAEAGFRLSFIEKKDMTTAFKAGMDYVAAL